jgi:hypothetical protein
VVHAITTVPETPCGGDSSWGHHGMSFLCCYSFGYSIPWSSWIYCITLKLPGTWTYHKLVKVTNIVTFY